MNVREIALLERRYKQLRAELSSEKSKSKGQRNNKRIKQLHERVARIKLWMA